MKRLREKLSSVWRAEFGEAYDNDVRERKDILLPSGMKFFEVIKSSSLGGYYSSDRGRNRYSKNTCYFCNRRDSMGADEIIAPYYHLRLALNVKFADVDHFLVFPLRHSEDPTEQDIRRLSQLSIKTGLSIIGNFRDSGASYPAHVHFQTLNTIFPVENMPGLKTWQTSGVRYHEYFFPVWQFYLSYYNKRSLDIVSRTITRLPKPFNLLFSGHNIYVCPRKKSIPFNTNGAKFASAEVFGRAYSRSQEFFDLMDYETVMSALCDVCLLPQCNEAKEYGELVKKIIKEVRDEI